MEYEFSEGLTGPEAHCTMGHEVFGHWLSQEIATKHEKIQSIQNALVALTTGKAWDFELTGFEFDLILSRNDALVKAHSLEADGEIDEDDMDFYDAESIARCGLEDFAALIEDWREFTL